MMDDAQLSHIRAVLNNNSVIQRHSVAEDFTREKPKFKVKIKVYSSFTEHPSDVINIMRKVRSMVPRTHAVEWTIRTVS